MPVDFVSFWLKPFGFFDRNPTLDLPPATSVRWRGAAGVLSESVAPRTRKCVYGGPPTQFGLGRERGWGRVGKVGWGYSPVEPSRRSRRRSAWPLWRAYSSIMCVSTQRTENQC
jgi:hypothetical protein